MSGFARSAGNNYRDLAQLASRQHGSVTRGQLLALGLSSSAIARLTKSGRLHAIFRGVYAVGRPIDTPLEQAAAAVLACGRDAVLAHTSALALWSLPGPGWPRQPIVLIAHRRRSRTGIETHISSTLTRRDIRTYQRIRVTSPARTLLDCAAEFTEQQARRAVNAALRRNLVRRTQLRELLERCPLHPGARALAEFADERPGMNTRSPLEDDFESFCLRYDLPRPTTNVLVNGVEVDAYFEHERLIVELDSWEFHGDPFAFENDRERDARQLAAGIVTLRLTWQRLHAHPEQEADRLHGILAARRAAA